MPRPRRAYGRPGTAVIPDDWEASHALVVNKTHTARCRITAPANGPTISDDLDYAETPAEMQYEGACRVQALSNSETTRLFGEAEFDQSAYLVVIDRDSSAQVGRGSVVDVTDSSDERLNGASLVVSRADLGTLRWERDLYCTEQPA